MSAKTQPADPHDSVSRASSRPPTPVADRRSLLSLAVVAAASLVPRSARAQARAPRRTSRPVPRHTAQLTVADDIIAPFAEWNDPLLRLVRRVTLGITPADVAHAQEMGFQQYLNEQLNYARIDDTGVEEFVASKWPVVNDTAATLFSLPSGTVQQQLQEATIYRAAFSARQLYHRMVELWSDHFNQNITKVGYLLVGDQRDVIRAHALGRFPDLLRASAHSPSMLAYLDQNTSRAGAPNQNYAREIMELHTLGVNGGYTQTDVAELSRVLTGWTIEGRGQFVFNPALHDWGQKTVLGVTIPAGSPSMGVAGQLEGEMMLDVLTSHPSCARFIATKLLRWLLDPNPSESQISAIASVYRATGGDIKAMVRAILNDQWVAAAPMKLKRPFHYLVSALRSADPTITSITPMNSQLNALGQPLFLWETPDGYPDSIDYWAGNIVPRWAFGGTLANLNSTTTLVVDTTPYRAGTPDAAVDLIEQNFFGGELPLATRTALLNYIKGGSFTDARVRETIGLAIGANAFQWY